jgi:glycosyltransferase involved in cell wall biosynthesis
LTTFALVSNGFADGPAQAFRDYLVAGGAEVFAVEHPLTPEDGTRHVIRRYESGAQRDERTLRVPLRPPVSYAVDPLVPLVPPRVEAWFGFNPLACARGLLARAYRGTRLAYLWSVDFVPDRFGANTAATRIYDRLDRLSCVRANARVELSEAAREGRDARHRLPPDAPPAYVVPMGAWLDRVPTTTPNGWERKRVVFLGHLVERQGVDLLLAAVALLVQQGEDVHADIIGTGPLEETLRERAQTLGIERFVHFHGFVAEHADVERLLAEASVAVAPYAPTAESFTRYADPGKLKAYVAAGLPTLLTDVPPNARELAAEAGAEIVPHDAHALAEAISRAVADAQRWQRRRDLALAYAKRFDWNLLFGDLLAKLGLTPA